MADKRLLSITSTLGADALIPTRLSVTERLGEPYTIQVEVLGSNPDLQAKDLLTKPITATVTQPRGGAPTVRHFHGLVVQWERLGPAAAGRTRYRLVAVPGLWRLGLRQNCRIFQDKTVRDIVNAVLSEHDQPEPTWGITPALQPIPYCTQFNESDLNFVSRLLQEYGLTCYFSHTASAHKLHISGTAPGFPAFAGDDVTVVHGSELPTELSSWHRANRARTASVALTDMDEKHLKPSVVLTKRSDTRATANEPAMWAAGKLQHWPGGMSTRPGLDPAAVQMAALETASEDFEGDTIDPRFAAGVRVGVSLRAENGQQAKQQYVVTSVQHEAEDQSGLTAGAGGTEHYQGSLRLVSAARTWMPQAHHARPVMAGLHSAKVTGPSGEQIHVDKFGRIKVKFRWDSAGPSDDASSCWVRVAQAAAGAWGGTWFLPRVGDEVLVAFLDGDPDRPVVTGSLFNEEAKPPFNPEQNRSQSGISTRSYKSTSSADANVLRFEDKKDAEQVLLHAQKDLKVEVENDETRTIDRDQTEEIKRGRTVKVKADDKLTVQSGNRKVTIESGNDELTISQGNLTVKCSAGSVMIDAMQKITLKVGKNSVVIDQSGITTKGIMITEEAQAMHKTKSPMVKVDADGMVMVKGGVVMLN